MQLSIIDRPLRMALFGLLLVALAGCATKGIDLRPWKLQGQDDELNRIAVLGPELSAGFANKWFYAPSPEELYFKCPSNGEGITLGRSPRVELRQMEKGANWKLADDRLHRMKVSCTVLEILPKTETVIIGQIHGHQTRSEIIKLRWNGTENGKCFVEARFQRDDPDRTEYGVTLAEGLSLGDPVEYELVMHRGKVAVTVNGKTGIQVYTPEFYDTDDRYYFKAGNYFQYVGNTVEEYCLMKITAIELSEPYVPRGEVITGEVSAATVKP